VPDLPAADGRIGHVYINQTAAGATTVVNNTTTTLATGPNGNAITTVAGGTVTFQSTAGNVTIAGNVTGAGTISLIATAGQFLRTVGTINPTTMIFNSSLAFTAITTATGVFAPANLQITVTNAANAISLLTSPVATMNILGLATNNSTILLQVPGSVTINGTLANTVTMSTVQIIATAGSMTMQSGLVQGGQVILQSSTSFFLMTGGTVLSTTSVITLTGSAGTWTMTGGLIQNTVSTITMTAGNGLWSMSNGTILGSSTVTMTSSVNAWQQTGGSIQGLNVTINATSTGLGTVNKTGGTLTATQTSTASAGLFVNTGLGGTFNNFVANSLRVTCSNNTLTLNGGTNTVGLTTLTLVTQFFGNGSVTITHAGNINLNIVSNIAMNAATSTITLNSGGTITWISGTITALRLNLNAVTGINGFTGTNNVAQLQAVNSASGNITFTSTAAGGLTLVGLGVRTPTGTVTLTSAGAITTNGLLVRGTTLILSSVGGATFTNVQISNLQATNTTSGAISVFNNQSLTIIGTGVSNTGGDVTISTGNGTGNLTVSGNVSVSGTLTLDAFIGALVQTSGSIQATNFAAFADFGIDLRNVGTTNLHALNFDAGTIDIAGSGNLTLVVLSNSSNGVMNVDGDIRITAAGSIDGLTGVVAFTGSIMVAANGNLAATGEFEALNGSIQLTAGGSFDMGTTGFIEAGGVVTLRAGGNVDLNSIDTPGALSVITTGGNLDLASTGIINVGGKADFQAPGGSAFDGDVNAGGDLTLVLGGAGVFSASSGLTSGGAIGIATGGDMTLSGAVDAQGALTAVSQGALTQDFTGTITAQSVGLNSLGGLLTIAGNTSMSGNFVGYGLTGLTQGTTGAINAGNVTLNTPGAASLNLVNASGAVTLDAGLTITQAPSAFVTATGDVSFQAGGHIFLGRVHGGFVSIVTTGGAIIDNNDTTPNALNVSSTGDVILAANTNIGSLVDPIEIQAGGFGFVATNGAVGIPQVALSGTTSDGTIHVLAAPIGTLIFFNGHIVVTGGDTPDRLLNSLRTANEYATWAQAVIGDDDTIEAKVLLRFKSAPKRPRAALK
jgi:hypothetical protein